MNTDEQKMAETIGKLFKSANDLKFHYYETQERIDDVPENTIVKDCLSIFFRNPQDGIKMIEKKIYPFKRFCLSRIKHKEDHDKSSVIKLSRFNKLMKFVKLNINNINQNDINFQNLILLEILK